MARVSLQHVRWIVCGAHALWLGEGNSIVTFPTCLYIDFPPQISSAMWPHTSLRYGVIKAAVETISYTPAAMTCFYFIMSLLESKTVQEAVAEVGKKFLPTYKVYIPI